MFLVQQLIEVIVDLMPLLRLGLSVEVVPLRHLRLQG